jgi:hypothetical protein
MRFVAGKPIVEGSLPGFTVIESPVGLKIHDIPVLVGPRGASSGRLPSKPMLADGRPRVDVDANPISPIVGFRDPATAERCYALVMGLIRAKDPDVLRGGYPPGRRFRPPDGVRSICLTTSAT